MRSSGLRDTPLTLFFGSAVSTCLAAVPVRRLLTVHGRFDVPNHRSSHKTPVPRGGGIAGLVGAGFSVLASGRPPQLRRALGIATLAVVGWADDVTGHTPAMGRMASQLVVGGWALSASPQDRLTGAVVTGGVVNVVNFMDGINGISGLTALTWGVNAMLLDDESGGDLSTLGALTAGAGLGFLPHNVPSARLFLGDVGSYALGAAMAAGILSQRSLAGRYRVAAPLLLYGVDATQALLRRALAGEKLGEAHRQHVYQVLVDGGRAHLTVAVWHAAGATAVAAASRHRLTVSVPVTVGVALAYLLSANARRAGTETTETIETSP